MAASDRISAFVKTSLAQAEDTRPLYQKIAEALTEAIGTGALGVDRKLPSERSLAAHLGVSRVTVRRALDELAASGLLKRRQGAREEQRWRDRRFRSCMVLRLRPWRAFIAGIRAYFSSHPLPGTLLAKTAPRKHVIARGDTLGGIAQQYQVSLSSLRSANKLSNDRILVGQVLHIPET